jgi:streptomycin 6-kinase
VSVPAVDEAVRRRLTARFGDSVAGWFNDLPDVLSSLAHRWDLELVESIPRGSVSVVLRCRLPDGRPAVLKVSPDLARMVGEAACLAEWVTAHTPSVLAVDERVGALLLEAIEPGTPLEVSGEYPLAGHDGRAASLAARRRCPAADLSDSE